MSPGTQRLACRAAAATHRGPHGRGMLPDATDCHGYRSRAFLLPEDRVCRCCGKLFASIGRLRRHLAAAPRCLTGWGTFRPRKDAASAPVHDLAAPCEWDGEVVPAPGFDFSGGVNGALLQELTALEGGDETAVWEAIVGCIEPLCTLRSTVEAWSSAEPCTEWRREVAQNMLLLLDPDLIADTRQPQRVRSPGCFTCPASGYSPCTDRSGVCFGPGGPTAARRVSPRAHEPYRA